MVISSLANILENQRHRLILWVPVMFGTGIVIYFSFSTEPSTTMTSTIALIGMIFACFIRLRNIVWSCVLITFVLVLFGISYAAFRTGTIETPVLKRHYYGPVYGRIIRIDRSASNARRVLLDRIYLPGYSVNETPHRVRISLQGFIPPNTLIAGNNIAVTASLSPPSPPVEPGGFDFRRMAWFMSLGAVGYTRNPVIPAMGNGDHNLKMKLYSFRMWMSDKIKRAVGGQSGAFASAILTGDRSDVDPLILESLRTSNLAHLLAISGLHMGLLSGTVFALMRYGFALFPYISLRVRSKKIAAGIAIGAGAFYLMLSGASVATQRAFIMTTVVLFAIILDKPAFTLRTVALAALIVLLIKPYSVLEAGFQMSFAATTALISAFEALNARRFWVFLSRGKWKYVKPVIALLFTSAVAGAATAPISAFHFNQISQFGLAANMMAVPIMGLLVMPSAVVAIIVIPFGLEGLAFWVMGKGIGAILSIAVFFSELDGSAKFVPSAPNFIFAGIVVGGLILFLWQGRGRLVGLLVIILTLFVWGNTQRPQVLIAEDGKMFGLLMPEGRIVNKPRGSGYSVRIWLENDGDDISQNEAFVRSGIYVQNGLAIADIQNDWRVVLYSKDDLNVVRKNCAKYTVLILPKLKFTSDRCLVIDANYLRYSGAISLDIRKGYPVLEHSREAARNRPWGY